MYFFKINFPYEKKFINLLPGYSKHNYTFWIELLVNKIFTRSYAGF